MTPKDGAVVKKDKHIKNKDTQKMLAQNST